MRTIASVLAAALFAVTGAVVTTRTAAAQPPGVPTTSSFRDIARAQSPVVVLVDVRARDGIWDDAGEELQRMFGLDAAETGPHFVHTAASGLHAATLGDSSLLEPRDWVILRLGSEPFLELRRD